MADDKTPGFDNGEVFLPIYLLTQWKGCVFPLTLLGVLLFLIGVGYLLSLLF